MSETTAAPSSARPPASTIASVTASGTDSIVSAINDTIRALLAAGGFQDRNPGGDTVRYSVPGSEFYFEVAVSLTGDVKNPAIEAVYRAEAGSPHAGNDRTQVFVSYDPELGFAFRPGDYPVDPKPIANLAQAAPGIIGMTIALAIPQSHIAGS